MATTSGALQVREGHAIPAELVLRIDPISLRIVGFGLCVCQTSELGRVAPLLAGGAPASRCGAARLMRQASFTRGLSGDEGASPAIGHLAAIRPHYLPRRVRISRCLQKGAAQ